MSGKFCTQGITLHGHSDFSKEIKHKLFVKQKQERQSLDSHQEKVLIQTWRRLAKALPASLKACLLKRQILDGCVKENALALVKGREQTYSSFAGNKRQWKYPEPVSFAVWLTLLLKWAHFGLVQSFRFFRPGCHWDFLEGESQIPTIHRLQLGFFLELTDKSWYNFSGQQKHFTSFSITLFSADCLVLASKADSHLLVEATPFFKQLWQTFTMDSRVFVETFQSYTRDSLEMMMMTIIRIRQSTDLTTSMWMGNKWQQQLCRFLQILERIKPIKYFNQ